MAQHQIRPRELKKKLGGEGATIPSPPTISTHPYPKEVACLVGQKGEQEGMSHAHLRVNIDGALFQVTETLDASEVHETWFQGPWGSMGTSGP